MAMYTGTQKKAIVIKNTGNSIFEAAYFILKDDLSNVKESEMVREANKILKNNIIGGYFFEEKKKDSVRTKAMSFLYFFTGALAASFVCAFIFMLLK